jgi:8-oxo-dGTP pyrophosphatase MutT (NUDIX family)
MLYLPQGMANEAEAAAQEAKEEAGVPGTVSKHPIGQYFYWK